MKERPDLVITYLYMPEKEGLETIMELRQTDKQLRILAISGGGLNTNMAEMLTTAKMFGANAVMVKREDWHQSYHLSAGFTERG